MLPFFGNFIEERLDFVVLGSVLKRSDVCVMLYARAYFEIFGIGDKGVAEVGVDGFVDVDTLDGHAYLARVDEAELCDLQLIGLVQSGTKLKSE